MYETLLEEFCCEVYLYSVQVTVAHIVSPVIEAMFRAQLQK